MDAFHIDGGRRLRGRVRVHGSKNACLPLMAAALLTDEPVVLHDVPNLADIRNMARLLSRLGVKVEWTHPPKKSKDQAVNGAGSTLRLEVCDDSKVLAPYDIVKTMRASICTLGPLLAKRGRARVSMPGGCNIGDRPVDLHQRGLKTLGARMGLDKGYIVAQAPDAGRLVGARVFMGGPYGSTVLGTDNILCAAVLARGTTVIESAACEPEVVDLANMLTRMGARICGAGSPRIVVEGVDKLKGVEHVVMADRIEAGTYIMAAAITNGDLVVDNCPTDALTAVLDRLAEIGVQVQPVKGEGGRASPRASGGGDVSQGSGPKGHPGAGVGAGASGGSGGDPMRQTVHVSSSRRLDPVQVVTQPHPGFPTDLQAQIMSLLCLADGNSIITEKIFPDRFMHVAELLRMGAGLIRNGSAVLVTGVKELIGAPVMASDLRASAGLVLAGLAARGTTTVHRVYHLDRGYDKMDSVLQSLGASIERIAVQGP